MTPVTRVELVEQVLAGWPQAEVARLTSPALPSSGCDGSVKVAMIPCTATRQTRPISYRKRPSALHDACSPGGRTASGGGWALPALSTPSCAAPDSTASRGCIAPHGRSFATSMPARARWFTVKKLGRIPQGGGKRIPWLRRDPQRSSARPPPGFDFLHVAVDTIPATGCPERGVRAFLVACHFERCCRR